MMPSHPKDSHTPCGGVHMTAFANKTMPATELIKVRSRMSALQLALRAPHDLIMFCVQNEDDIGQDDVYIGLPNADLLNQFPGFQQVEQASLPDYLSTLMVREDEFAERFPDIARKRKTKYSSR
jgi:hypothetical protein